MRERTITPAVTKLGFPDMIRRRLEALAPADAVKPSEELLARFAWEIGTPANGNMRARRPGILPKFVRVFGRGAREDETVQVETTKPSVLERLIEASRLAGPALVSFLLEADPNREARFNEGLIIGDIKLLVAGDMLTTTFLTANLPPDPTRTCAATLCLSLDAGDIDSRERVNPLDDCLLFGWRNDRAQIIGLKALLQKDLEPSPPNKRILSAFLKAQGYQDIGAFRLVEWNIPVT